MRKITSFVLALILCTGMLVSTYASDAPSEWAEDGVNQAITMGLVPRHLQAQYTQAITRAEFANLAAHTYFIGARRNFSAFLDFYDTDYWYVSAIAGLGVVTGMGDGNFAPYDLITREQAAVMAARLAYQMDIHLPQATAAFADNDQISYWAIDSVAQMQAANIMSGVGGNMFDPMGTFTREQSVVMLHRLFEMRRPIYVRAVPGVTVPMPIPSAYLSIHGSVSDVHAYQRWLDNMQQGFFPYEVITGRIRGGSTSTGGGYLYNFSINLSDGTIWGWGENVNGWLGNGTREDSAVPVLIMDGVFDGMASSSGVALRHNGDLLTWGGNQNGLVGDGTTADRLSPFLVMDNVVAYAKGGSAIIALQEDGTLWAWGNNRNAMLGDGTTTNRHTPVQILDNVVSIGTFLVGSQPRFMALCTEGHLWSWGQNRFLALSSSYEPIIIVRDFEEPQREVGVGRTLIDDNGNSLGHWTGFSRQL